MAVQQRFPPIPSRLSVYLIPVSRQHCINLSTSLPMSAPLVSNKNAALAGKRARVYIVGVGMTKVGKQSLWAQLHGGSFFSSPNRAVREWITRTWSRRLVSQGRNAQNNLFINLVVEALDDAGMKYEQIEQGRQPINSAGNCDAVQFSKFFLATASYMYGGSCCGQRALYEIGLTGIPIFNVSSNT